MTKAINHIQPLPNQIPINYIRTKSSSEFIKLPTILSIGFLLLSLYSFFTTNPYHTFFSILILFGMVKLLWRNNEPPVLFFSVFFQWLAVTIKVFYANFLNEKYVEVFTFPAVLATIDKAFILSIIGIGLFATGAHIAIRSIKYSYGEKLFTLAQTYNTRKLTSAYLIFSLTLPFITYISYITPGLQQPVFIALRLKWSFFFLLFFIVTVKQENRQNFYLILLMEVILGFTGYFSAFKDFIIIFAISFLTFGIRLKPLQYIIFFFGGIVTFNLAVIWTYIKPQYRNFLSGGQSAQIVTVSKGDALGKLSELYSGMTPENFKESEIDLINRISYIEYFSACINYIPENIPHREGEIWIEALQHVLVPRVLDPNKPIIDDSEQTAKYTGMFISGRDTGTSISLGYMAESYADFGEVTMFIPVFLLGFLTGIIYKYFISNAINQVWGYGLVMPMFFFTNVYGTAAAKILGALLLYFIIAYLINRFILNYLDRWIRN